MFLYLVCNDDWSMKNSFAVLTYILSFSFHFKNSQIEEKSGWNLTKKISRRFWYAVQKLGVVIDLADEFKFNYFIIILYVN